MKKGGLSDRENKIRGADIENMEEKLSPKVEALYRAVMELLLEGRQIRKMKVSEITEKAGIGKGTAYEYFESKEELLVDALNYFQKIWAENAWKELSHCDSFMEMAERMFDLLDSMMKKVKREAVVEICNLFFFSPLVRKEKGSIVKRLYSIVEKGRRGGELKEELPDDYIVLVLAGRAYDYVSYYLNLKMDMENICTPEQIKRYLLDGIRIELLKEH